MSQVSRQRGKTAGIVVACSLAVGFAVLVILNEMGIVEKVFSLIGGYAFGGWLHDWFKGQLDGTDGDA